MDPRGLFVARMLDTSARSLAAGVVGRLEARGGNQVEGTASFRSRLADVESRIAHLAESVAVGTSTLFCTHVEWLRAAYEAREVPLAVLDASLESLRDELDEQLDPSASETVRPQLDDALALLRRARGPSLVGGGSGSPRIEAGPHGELARRFLLAQLENRRGDALALLERAYADGIGVSDLEVHVLAAAQAELGALWQRGEIQIAEEHLGSSIVDDALGLLGRYVPTPMGSDRRALVATVAGNVHSFGARVVSHHFRLAGWRTDCLGADLPADEVVWAAREHASQVVALSATLPLHVRATADAVEALRAAGLPSKVLVGGRPFEEVPELWRAVGADHGSNDVRAVALEAERLIAG